MKTTSIKLPPALHRDAKAHAAQLGVTLQGYITGAILSKLAKRKGGKL